MEGQELSAMGVFRENYSLLRRMANVLQDECNRRSELVRELKWLIALSGAAVPVSEFLTVPENEPALLGRDITEATAARGQAKTDRLCRVLLLPPICF